MVERLSPTCSQTGRSCFSLSVQFTKIVCDRAPYGLCLVLNKALSFNSRVRRCIFKSLLLLIPYHVLFSYELINLEVVGFGSLPIFWYKSMVISQCRHLHHTFAVVAYLITSDEFLFGVQSDSARLLNTPLYFQQMFDRSTKG